MTSSGPAPKADSKVAPKVAIVADWIIGGGAERVVSELHAIYPDAPIYASYCSDDWRKHLENKVVTGYLQRWPFSSLRKFAGLISPFRISWYKRLDFSNFDVVISATGNGEAKHIRVPASTKHICYCFTPVHYYWRQYQTYLKDPGFGPLNWLARLGLKLLSGPLRHRDYAAAQLPDQFIAISKHIQADIKEFYGRDADIISPPVDVDRFLDVGAKSTNRTGFITMGRQTPYKRTDLIVDVCTAKNLPLLVIGNGPQHDDLVKRAGPAVKFSTTTTDAEMPESLASAQAFLFAATEDFGVAPVEAMAAGTPVIALRAGGALDYVVEAKTGLFFNEPTVENIGQAIDKFAETSFNTKTIQAKAVEFSSEVFRTKIQSAINNAK